MIGYKDFLKFENEKLERIDRIIRYHNDTSMHACRSEQEITDALNSCIVLNIKGVQYRNNPTDTVKVTASQDMKQVNLHVPQEDFEGLDTYIRECTNLQCLWIEKSVEITDAFFEIPNLKYLFIRECRVNEKMNQILNIESLRILYLNETDLAYLPKEIRNLENLEALSLMQTSIQTLPEELAQIVLIKNI